MPALGFVFRIHTLSETSKKPPQYIFAGDRSFRQLSAMPLPCFVQHKLFAHWPKEIESFAKFQTTVSSNCSCGQVKRNFDIFARNFIQEAEIFCSLSKHVEGKTFPFWKVLLKWFFQTGRIQLCQTRRRKMCLRPSFFWSISAFEKN